MRCKSCQLLGHTLKHCKNPAACVSCNLAPHLPIPCTRIFCANCNGEHPASSPSFPQYQTQKNLLHIKTSKKCSFREARMILKQQDDRAPQFHECCLGLLLDKSPNIRLTIASFSSYQHFECQRKSFNDTQFFRTGIYIPKPKKSIRKTFRKSSLL